jgi:hypothetical protein
MEGWIRDYHTGELHHFERKEKMWYYPDVDKTGKYPSLYALCYDKYGFNASYPKWVTPTIDDKYCPECWELFVSERVKVWSVSSMLNDWGFWLVVGNYDNYPASLPLYLVVQLLADETSQVSQRIQ